MNVDIIEIAILSIDEDTDQPRYQFDEDSLQELMKSIEELGLLSPIKVRTQSDGRYKIIYGNRRYKACKMLGKQTIPCIVSNVTDELEIYLEQIAENLTRQGFTPIEEAEAFHKLLHDTRFSSSTKYLSSKLGKPESYIKNKLELLKFGAAVKKLVISGTEIKKNKLTEEQLLPLRDLPIEHRDPLALIIARDEMPVSDVKKIAGLFKEKSISASTKDKLLYKSGRDLLETWSVFRHNKAEREKQAEAKAKESLRKETSEAKQPEEAPAAFPAASTPAAASPAPALQNSLQSSLRNMLTALSTNSTLSTEIIESLQYIASNDKTAFIHNVDSLIASLEQHLAEWKKVRELADKETAQV
jgi:ParB family transcriptional regulator, chromosome partitioning protein